MEEAIITERPTKACAPQLSPCCFRLAWCCRVFASARKLEALADLQEQGIECVQLDVTSEQSVREAVEAVLQAAGRIDLLVNNAGVGSWLCFYITNAKVGFHASASRTALDALIVRLRAGHRAPGALLTAF
jgi:NAD(P)-dependent dehydrogenase (short-subunit alcohol dehydrogenase family)